MNTRKRIPQKLTFSFKKKKKKKKKMADRQYKCRYYDDNYDGIAKISRKISSYSRKSLLLRYNINKQ